MYDHLFHFDTFELNICYKNIAINILKLQKKLLIIFAESDSNNVPLNSQFIIDQQSILNMKGKVFVNLVNRHTVFFTKQYIYDIELEYIEMI